MISEKDKLPVSAVIITLNEQKNIVRCINSLQWADEILVYDSGSTDQTIALASNLGAKVISGSWLGFGRTKHKAAELARHEWIFSLDADEECSVDLKNEIFQKFTDLDKETAYQIPRLSYYLNRWIRHGGWYPDYQVRLFHKKYSQWNHNKIHEKVEAKHNEKLKSPLYHYVFKNIEDQVQTNNRYSSLLALQMKEAGKKFSWFHFFTKPKVKFFECYFLKLGFLDGWPGFVIAVNAAHSIFMKWSKLRELSLDMKSEGESG